ncbi:hypothetical protein SCG7086_CC_00010 [Chlamydiales bacterium SCGC AG-110-P3]|nr:hypothetical protein SCG7086_CC_00010 [Chlamydiales bacterium SCGC AG-110-P3]
MFQKHGNIFATSQKVIAKLQLSYLGFILIQLSSLRGLCDLGGYFSMLLIVRNKGRQPPRSQGPQREALIGKTETKSLTLTVAMTF